MGYFIDLMYVLYELAKLSFLVVTSPFGIVAGCLLVWQ
jgi:hypothetical protein